MSVTRFIDSKVTLWEIAGKVVFIRPQCKRES